MGRGATPLWGPTVREPREPPSRYALIEVYLFKTSSSSPFTFDIMGAVVELEGAKNYRRAAVHTRAEVQNGLQFRR